MNQLTHDDKVNKLNVTTIYPSISGEAGPVFPQGTTCIFLRLQGCPLRCVWCDAAETLPYTPARLMDVQEAVDECMKHGTRNVVLTGGEPLSQRQAVPLIMALLDRGFCVQVETSGAVSIPNVVHSSNGLGWVVDIKMPGSGELRRNKAPERLVPEDGRPTHFKFVCADTGDIDYAMDYIQAVRSCPVQPQFFLLSPVDGGLDIARLITQAMMESLWVEARSRLVLSLQIHKYINMP